MENLNVNLANLLIRQKIFLTYGSYFYRLIIMDHDYKYAHNGLSYIHDNRIINVLTKGLLTDHWNHVKIPVTWYISPDILNRLREYVNKHQRF